MDADNEEGSCKGIWKEQLSQELKRCWQRKLTGDDYVVVAECAVPGLHPASKV